MGAAILTDLLIPVAAVVGIGFALIQWGLVSRVKLSPERRAPPAGGNDKNDYSDYLIEEEEGLNDHNVVVKCAEIRAPSPKEPLLSFSPSISMLEFSWLLLQSWVSLSLALWRVLALRVGPAPIAKTNIASLHLQMLSFALCPSCLVQSLLWYLVFLE